MTERAWYCVHTKTKCEHIVAAALRQIEGVEAFCPRIKFQRSTTRGKVWFIEALFPTYLFARFNIADHHRMVKYTHNVIRVLEFGGHCISIADRHIDEIRSEMDGMEVREISIVLKVGDSVELAEGPMRGFKGVIERISQGADRVRLLLDFLGRQSFVEVPMETLLKDMHPRQALATTPTR
jgi:transcriptional antiterminator RfaH